MSSGTRVRFSAHVDGGARNNPGPAGFGVVIAVEGVGEVYRRAGSLGETTNNQAEYRALLHCLQALEDLRLDSGVIHSDSELLVKQLSGEYRVKESTLRPLHEEARRRLSDLGDVEIVHVRREENQGADALANIGIDWGLAEREEKAG